MKKEDQLLQNLRQLRLFLLISGFLNLILLTGAFYWVFKDRPPVPYVHLKPAEISQQQSPLADERSNSEVLNALKAMPLEQLLAKLNDPQLVENGYTQRDLALAVLVTFHHFDLQRALGREQSLPKPRLANVGNGLIVSIYPGLTEDQYRSILQFVDTERWPFSAQGLFSLAQNPLRHSDPSLQETFYHTPEFLTVEMLFKRSDVPVEKTELFDLVTEGDWKMLTEFTVKQQALQDLSPPRRQKFLLDYIHKGSRTAALLLLKTEHDFAVKKIDDHSVAELLRLLPEKSDGAENYAKEILASPRSDSVVQLSSKVAGVEIEPKKKPEDVLKPPVAQSKVFEKSLPKQIVKFSPQPKPTPPTPTVKASVRPQAHLVQEGDSLWKISKRYNVSLEELRRLNKLNSDVLKLGMLIKLPAETKK